MLRKFLLGGQVAVVFWQVRYCALRPAYIALSAAKVGRTVLLLFEELGDDGDSIRWRIGKEKTKRYTYTRPYLFTVRYDEAMG